MAEFVFLKQLSTRSQTQMCSNCQELRDEGKGYKPDLMGRRRLTGGPEQLLPTAVFC